MRYILLNKPYEVLTQFTDETGRQTLKDFVEIPEIYPVGRLDYDSEGLVLLTDDKQLQHRLSEPRFKVPKTYWVQVEGEPTPEALENLRRGVDLKTGYTSAAEVELLPQAPELWERSKPVRFRAAIPTSWLQIRISQGMNRQVRKMTAAVGYPTLRLVRAAIADMDLGDLQPGQWRELTNTEVRILTEEMAAQTAAAGTFKTPKPSEYWPGGIPPGGKKTGGKRGGFTAPGGSKTTSSKPNRPAGGPKSISPKPAGSRADAPARPAGSKSTGGKSTGSRPAGARPGGGGGNGKTFGTKPTGGKPGSKPGTAGGGPKRRG
ncbi:pseudouridine synthase [Hymenobacter terrestris]|uniref:Pseudouridine synthase n=1 Tax=Hymenobacter terrestris TaxID=2748310 RepID=A0ABX2Q276_9BACT|nr:pseudouridine synthase [Hymenobacter terrestris]NVO84121.1 pseudouridine synthase [Hymenobacter terrestris]